MNKILFISILILSAVLRIWNLNSVPALNADEAALGYNAYSLITTGKDEHGNPWPIHFQSFNDYKPGLMVYMIIPFVKLFGLNAFAVRFPGALFGIMSILGVYLLVKQLYPNRKVVLKKFEITLADIAALFLAISPWHIHFSRGAWEVNLSTFLIIFGVWAFLKSIQNTKYLYVSLTLFALSLYAYHSARIISPLIGASLILIYFKDFHLRLKSIVIAAILLITITSPLLIEVFSPSGVSRFKGVSIFSDVGPINRANEQRGEHNKVNSLEATLLHNKIINYSILFADNWIRHFNGEYLFLSGDAIQRNKVPETGQLYFYELFLICIGLFAIILNRSKSNTLLVLWLLLAPIASALTFQSPHALRSQNMVVPFVVISSMGLLMLLESIEKHTSGIRKGFLLITIIVGILWSFLRYEHLYWVHMAKEYPYSSQYGVEELVNYVSENSDKYTNIVVTDRYDQPYILFLFYLKYPPEKFQKDHNLTTRDQYGFSTVDRFDKYIFQSVKWDIFRDQYRGSLIVGTDKEIPDGFNIIKRIYFPNGTVAFKLEAN